MNGTSGPTQEALEARARALGEVLLERGWRAATAESCTGGWIAQAMTAIAGSSDWFEGGLVTYSNQAKIALLGVDAMLIERHGAVSAEVAAAMAEGALRTLGADLSCAVTGVAGPGGGSPAKPVGTVWFGFARGGAVTRTCMHRFAGDRRAVRAATVAVALEELAALAG
ncbi:MAG: nicotinamide-nucleotide amidohydrolase family protein [Gammaproteobacteria bacterium]